MSFIVLTRFADLQDGNRIYEAGDTYPRPGFDVSPERLAELAGSDNRIGQPLIVNVDAPCDACAVERAEKGIDAALNVDEETITKTVKRARKPGRSRQRG